ncbi:MAG TPA: ABC transporter permease [Nocardioides sp.]|uniref:ABC transporter permease n=1 Tax=Nocardioides sp. TaxID=35761 RepID=UPI002B551266|nr:ABC transporter permease [Nocardioides sp.]HTW17660.1 ABC transporter permease [Nocardioides sp.]
MTSIQLEAPRAARRARRAVRLGGLVKEPTIMVASGALLAVVLLAALGPLFWTVSPNQVNLAETLQPMSSAHPMGTDDLGRDVFARFLEGARLSLMVGAVVVLAGATIGGALGVVAGMSRQPVSGFLGWVINTLLSFPTLMLAMAVSVALGAGVFAGAAGLVLAAIPWYARVLRSEVLRIMSRPSVEAAVVAGAGSIRIARRNVIPHLMPTLLIQAASNFGAAILTLAALGFVGLGAQPPQAEWGSMITGGLQYALSGQWWIGVFPGLGLIVLVTATTVLADRARDILDPRGSYVRS